MATKTKKAARSLVPAQDNNIVMESLRNFGRRNMTTYAIAVNLDRSVPDLFDGLKPVQRRILWGTSKEAFSRFEKTARVVGVVMGRYHPHGDMSLASAIETMVNHPTPTMLGKGNWGSMTDNAAAMRYTNCRLSRYGQSFFDPDYINASVTSFVPNYDDKDVEPVTLPAQLPNVFLNGGEGIGVGITTGLPSFTPQSLIEVLTRMFRGEKLTPQEFSKTLKYHHRWGGRLVNTKDNKKQWEQMFVGSTANVQFESQLQVIAEQKMIVIDNWPPGTNLETFIKKIREMPECKRCYNSKGSATFTIECDPGYNIVQFNKFVEKVQKATQQRRSFKINVTQREAQTNDGITTFDTKFLSLSVPQLLVQWCRLRIQQELRSLAYRIKKVEEQIDYSETMIRACAHIDQIVQIIRSAKEPEKALVAKLKIEPYQATWICDLQLRKISKLDESQYKDKLKEQKALLKQLQKWQKRPKAKIADGLESMLDLIAKDQAFKDKEETQELTVV